MEELTFCKKCLEKHFLQIVAGDQDFWPKMKDMHYVFLQTRVPRLETGFFWGTTQSDIPRIWHKVAYFSHDGSQASRFFSSTFLSPCAVLSVVVPTSSCMTIVELWKEKR